MSQYFPKPYEPFGRDINVKVDVSNYVIKTGIKNISHVDTSSFALKSNLARLKTEIDKLDIIKLVSVPVDLNKLIDVVKNDVVENELKKIKTFDSCYFWGKSNFADNDGTENYLVFQPICRYFKVIAGVVNGNYIYYWISKWLSDERTNSIKISDYRITPCINYYDINKIRVGFDGGFLKWDQSIVSLKKIVNIYIVYE